MVNRYGEMNWTRRMINYSPLQSKRDRRTLPVILVLLCLLESIFAGIVTGDQPFRIDGYYLGATPEELGVRVEDDKALEEKFSETEANEVQLFFVRVKDRLRAYRIVKQEKVDEKSIKSILDNLKAKYGPPDKQQIKTSSVRPRYQVKYVTNIKNRAIWNISSSQEFVAEIDSQGVIYELIDHDPENIEAAKKRGGSGEEDFGSENWDPDY